MRPPPPKYCVWVSSTDFAQTSISIQKLITRLSTWVEKYPDARVRTDGIDLAIHLSPNEEDGGKVMQFLLEG